MDFNKLALFGAVKQRLAWLTQRQDVLARNIANADTPNYRPRDLKELRFGNVIKSMQPMSVEMWRTHERHIVGNRQATGGFADAASRAPFEASPSGNAVVLEEQMAKVNETAINHKLTTELYRKHLGMFRLAVGNRR